MTEGAGDSTDLTQRPETGGGSSEELWMVQAVIQPFKLDQVTRALEAIAGFSGMTVTRVRGFGREKLEDRTAARQSGPGGRSSREPLDDFTEKLRLDISVAGRRRADEVAAVVARVARTGNRGDGKIFMWQLARVIRVRTAQEGPDAL